MRFLKVVFLVFVLCLSISCQKANPAEENTGGKCKCTEGLICLNNRCVKACKSKADCDGNLICGTVGYCQPSSNGSSSSSSSSSSSGNSSHSDGGLNNDDNSTSVQSEKCRGDKTCTGSPEPCGKYGVCLDAVRPCAGELYLECDLDLCVPHYSSQENWGCMNDSNENCCLDNLDNDCDGKTDIQEDDCACEQCKKQNPSYACPSCCDGGSCDDAPHDDGNTVHTSCDLLLDKSKAVLDKSGHDNHGQIINNAMIVSAGHKGGGLRPDISTFSGTAEGNGYSVIVGDCGQLAQFVTGVTIEAWIYFDHEAYGAEAVGDGTFINNCVDPTKPPDNPYCGEFWIGHKSGVFTLLVDEDENVNVTNDSVHYTHHHSEFRIWRQENNFHLIFTNEKTPIKQWFHFSATYNHSDKNVVIYVNGNPMSGLTQQNVDNGIALLNPQSTVYFAKFNGIIDEIKLTNRAKTQQEIQQSMNDFSLDQGELLKYDFE